MEIPVYLFIGFLDSGKTKFIQETLEDERFNGGERTLLLVTEEGEEEYDPSTFAYPNVYVKTIDDESDLTEKKLNDLANSVQAERVVIEYNGMWMVSNLLNCMPENWAVYQLFMFADANSFEVYNQNMRQLVYDKLSLCEFVVFNRSDENTDKEALHKIVRAVSRRAQIAYEYEDGTVEYDEIEDPLPFDINADLVEIEDEDFALFYRDLSEEMNKYKGKRVRFKGIVARDERRLKKGTFVIGRHVMTCCVEDIRYAGMVAEWSGADTLKTRDWVIVEGTVDVKFSRVYARKGPVLTDCNVVMSEKPEKEVATFY